MAKELIRKLQLLPLNELLLEFETVHNHYILIHHDILFQCLCQMLDTEFPDVSLTSPGKSEFLEFSLTLQRVCILSDFLVVSGQCLYLYFSFKYNYSKILRKDKK